MKNLVLVCFLVLGASVSQAQVLVKGALSFDNTTSKMTTPASSDEKHNIMFMSLGGGYVLGSGLYLGAAYESKADKKTTVGSADEQGNFTHMGPAVGYSMGSWLFVFNYFMSAKLDAGSGTEFTGKGMGVDVAYGFDIGNNMKLGVQVAYRTFDFDDMDSSGTTFTSDLKTTELAPAVFLSWKM